VIVGPNSITVLRRAALSRQRRAPCSASGAQSRPAVGSAIYTWSRAYIARQQTQFEVSTTMANEYNDDEWLEEQLRSPSTSMHDELDDWLEQKLQSPIPAARPTIPPGKQLFS